MDINDFLNRKLTKTGEMPNGDNIYLITEKSVNAIKEQLRIDGVSQQRELLLAYEKFYSKIFNNKDDGKDAIPIIDAFIANNCS
jgi:hypothetical protein